jgi:hypothetical protein
LEHIRDLSDEDYPRYKVAERTQIADHGAEMSVASPTMRATNHDARKGTDDEPLAVRRLPARHLRHSPGLIQWWDYAHQIARALWAGDRLPPFNVYGPVLEAQETAYVSAEATYSRFAPGDDRYNALNVVAFARPAITLAIQGLVNHRREARSEGMPIKASARVIGVRRRNTVRALDSDGPPRYQRPPRGSLVDAVEPQIRELLRARPRIP